MRSLTLQQMLLAELIWQGTVRGAAACATTMLILRVARRNGQATTTCNNRTHMGSIKGCSSCCCCCCCCCWRFCTPRATFAYLWQAFGRCTLRPHRFCETQQGSYISASSMARTPLPIAAASNVAPMTMRCVCRFDWRSKDNRPHQKNTRGKCRSLLIGWVCAILRQSHLCILFFLSLRLEQQLLHQEERVLVSFCLR